MICKFMQNVYYTAVIAMLGRFSLFYILNYDLNRKLVSELKWVHTKYEKRQHL